MKSGLPKSELSARRKAFQRAKEAEARRDGRKLPPGIDAALKSGSPTRQRYREMMRHSSNEGRQGGDRVADEWADPVCGLYQFVYDMGPRPHDGRGELHRLNTAEPWSKENAEWRPPTTRKGARVPALEATELRKLRDARIAEIMQQAQQTGVDLDPGIFLRGGAVNYLYRSWEKKQSGRIDPPSHRFHDYEPSKAKTDAAADSSYARYGGRGLLIYPPWSSKNDTGFEEFAAWIILNIGHRPTKQHTLDRIDVNDDYRPGNVRWADKSEQRRNQRKVVDPVADDNQYWLRQQRQAELSDLGATAEGAYFGSLPVPPASTELPPGTAELLTVPRDLPAPDPEGPDPATRQRLIAESRQRVKERREWKAQRKRLEQA